MAYEYSHRNGEPFVPTIPGRYLIKKNGDEHDYIDLMVGEEYLWTSRYDRQNWQWYGPLEESQEKINSTIWIVLTALALLVLMFMSIGLASVGLE